MADEIKIEGAVEKMEEAVSPVTDLVKAPTIEAPVKGLNWKLVAGIAAGGLTIVGGSIAGIAAFKKHRKKKAEDEEPKEEKKSKDENSEEEQLDDEEKSKKKK